MKTEIRYSPIYGVILDRADTKECFSLEKYEKLIKDSKSFEKLYKQNINKIIKLIEKYTKRKKWQYDFIPIYIVDIKTKNKWKGFGDPLTIIIMKSKKMLYTLIHELVHLNLDLKKQLKLGEDKTEDLVIEISQKVWKDLKLGDWRK